MKKLLILLLTFGSAGLDAQIITNRLNVSLGGMVSSFGNAATISQGSFTYPSLFGNYDCGYGIEAAAEYVVSRIGVWTGLQFEYTRFDSWAGDATYFVLGSPVSEFASIVLPVAYFPAFLHLNSGRFCLGAMAAPVFAVHSLQWTYIQQRTEGGPDFASSEQKKGIGYRAGISLYLQNNNLMNFRLDVYHQYIGSTSVYYFDESMRSLNVALRYYIKCFKNRHYIYE